MSKYYTVYLSKDDSLVAAGTALQCAKQLGMTPDSFKCAVSRAKLGKRKKFIILVDDEDTNEDLNAEEKNSIDRIKK